MSTLRRGRWVTRLTSNGVPFQVWTKTAMRIPDNILDCVAYLYDSETDAKTGMKAGGSGFLIGVNSEANPERQYVYAVSNAHVVQKSPVLRLNTVIGGTDVLPLSVADWSMNPTTDIAVCPVGIPERFKYSTVDFNKFLTHELIQEHGIGIGDETFLVGRFINHDGTITNTPVARGGTVAMMPHEPIHSDGRKYLAYLVETRIIGGYSGSPVFVHVPPLSPRPKKPPTLEGHGQWLLGIEVAYIYERVPVKSNKTLKPTAAYYVEGNTGMSIVIPAAEIAEMIMSDENVQERRYNDTREIVERAESGIALASASVDFSRDDYMTALQKVSRRATPSLPDEASSGT